MANILIIAEHVNGKLKKYSIELAGKAKELAGASGGSVSALIFGDGAQTAAAELGHYGVKSVTVAGDARFKLYSGELYSKVLFDVASKMSPVVVIATASSMGKDVMARASFGLSAGLASDCVAAELQGDVLKVMRPVYAGRAITDVVVEGPVRMATLRPNIFPAPPPNSSAPEIISYAGAAVDVKARVVNVVEAESGMLDLTEADRIVSGGRAMGNADNFKIIKELATVLGASVGASRAAVDAGFISHDHQVGQTGKTVNPTLYVACGISGAIQHLAGMRTSKIIIAINKDPEAPIFSKADYGIVGDLFKVVPAITEAVKKLLAE